MFDFPERIKEKLIYDNHGSWHQYILNFKNYKLYIQMPNKSENTMELFINEGNRELMGNLILKPNQFNNLVDIIENGGIYREDEIGVFRTKQSFYFKNINMPIETDKKLVRVY